MAWSVIDDRVHDSYESGRDRTGELGDEGGKMMRGRLNRWVAIVLLAALALTVTGTVAADEKTGLLPIVRFEGIVESRPADGVEGTWVISGQHVEVVARTRIVEREGPAEQGARVVVNATRSKEQLTALQIRVVEPAQAMTRIKGIVSELVSEDGRTYTVVNGLKVEHNDATEIDGQLEAGALVKIDALVSGSGLLATKIEVLGKPWIPKIVEFEGTIESMEDSSWVVDGHEFTAGERTIIVGRAEVGKEAEVRALEQSDGSLLALWIRVKQELETESWEGRIDRLPWLSWGGFWIVDDRAVLVTPLTESTGPEPEVGMWAVVEAERRGKLPWHAVKIEVKEPPSAESATL
jgi:hypothetical protein